MLWPLLLLLSPVHFAEFPVHFPGFQISDSSAGGVVLKTKMSKNHTRMAAVDEECEMRHLPMARHFITGCLFIWDILERKKSSWSMHTGGPAPPCWGGLVSTNDLLCDSEFYPVTLYSAQSPWLNPFKKLSCVAFKCSSNEKHPTAADALFQ